MAGIWPSSFQQIFDAATGKPIVGAVVSFFEAGTTTPLDVFKDYSLGTQHPANIEADSNGRWPAVYLDDGFYKVRVRAPGGSLLYEADGIPVIGVSDGGGSGSPVDPDALADVGDIKAHYGTAALAGWVICNGTTIGSATSGATQRANADCENLFLHLWGVRSGLVVGGAGASAAADWAANKEILIPDLRGRTPFGRDSMGGSASARIASSLVSSGDEDLIGSSGGVDQVTLTTTQIPAHTHSALRGDAAGTVTLGDSFEPGSPLFKAATSSSSAGGGGAHTNMPPFLLVTWYMKL